MPDPIRFVFGVHLHQPVGNFGYVLQQHLEEVYQPFLDVVEDAAFLPVVLHLSGPLLEATPPATLISYQIETVAQSERGLDRTVQGECRTLVWPAALGQASIRLTPERG